MTLTRVALCWTLILPIAARAQTETSALAQLRGEAGPAASAQAEVVARTAAARGSDRDSGELLVRLYDGTRQPLPEGTEVLLHVFDGYQKQIVSRFVKDSSIRITDLPVYGNFRDDYRAIVAAKGYKDAGFFPVRMTAAGLKTVDLMLVPKNARFDFSRATWDAIKAKKPDLYRMLMENAPDVAMSDEGAARKRYEDLMKNRPESLACMLNITTAMEQLIMPSGRSAVSYFDEFVWDDSMAKDRFFAYADYDLLAQTRLGAAHGKFDKERNPGIFHKGAFTSFKQIEFGETNVQLTFHHDVTHTHPLTGEKHILMEPDIDLYKDLLAHGLFEVIPGFFSLTDPKDVYPMRWMAGRQAGEPEFDPLYSLVR